MSPASFSWSRLARALLVALSLGCLLRVAWLLPQLGWGRVGVLGPLILLGTAGLLVGAWRGRHALLSALRPPEAILAATALAVLAAVGTGWIPVPIDAAPLWGGLLLAAMALVVSDAAMRGRTRARAGIVAATALAATVFYVALRWVGPTGGLHQRTGPGEMLGGLAAAACLPLLAGGFFALLPRRPPPRRLEVADPFREYFGATLGTPAAVSLETPALADIRAVVEGIPWLPDREALPRPVPLDRGPTSKLPPRAPRKG